MKNFKVTWAGKCTMLLQFFKNFISILCHKLIDLWHIFEIW